MPYSSIMPAQQKLKEVAALLASQGIHDSVEEAEILITETLRTSKTAFYSGKIQISESQSREIDANVSRRMQGEPLQYILGHVEFYGLKINVGRGVLIPRPETELLVEEAIKQLKKRFTVHGSRFTVLDLCTGSGCIALALARHLPDTLLFGVDASDAALSYAIQNAEENGIANVQFRKGDLFGPVEGMVFDCIVSNPPYIRKREIQCLQREIRDYEPVEALDGGNDGLDFYRRILKDASKHLKEHGLIILEIGYGQADEVREIAEDSGFKEISFINDYAGIERIFLAQR